jgi:hypothetical protein
MNIHFEPPHLEVAQSAKTFGQLVEEMAANHSGELRVLQNFRGEPTRLILVSPGLAPVSTEVPHRWLDQPLAKEEIRSRLATLFRHLPVEASA